MNDFDYKLPILNIKGEQINRVFDLSMFKDIDLNEHLVYLAIKNYLANKRQGTHKAKERSEIKGSTRKLFRQKGTGRARRGSITSPLLRGGARVFGPKPRDYGFKMNKNEKRLAILSSFKSKLENNIINVIDNFSIVDHKTRNFINVMNDLKMSDKKNLLIYCSDNDNLVLGSRNLKNVDVRTFNFINTYDIISSDRIYFEEKAILGFLSRMEI